MANNVRFEKGSCYTRQQICDMVGGGSVHNYMPSKDGRILCACLSQAYDPSAPAVILVGAGPAVQREAELFCTQNTAVPVFFKKQANLWEYAGSFVPERSTSDPEELVPFAESSGRVNLTRVIFLRESEQ